MRQCHSAHNITVRICPPRPFGRLGGRPEYFGRLILLLYLIISAIAPLSAVHMEDQAGSLYLSAGHAGSEAGTVLVRLHELLFKHLSDRADHAAFSRGPCPERPLEASGTTIGTAMHMPSLIFRGADYAQAYSRSQDGATPTPDGFRHFCSSLSPPAA